MKNPSTDNLRTPQKRGENDVFNFKLGSLFANNDEYASKSIIFDILAISFEEGKGFEGSDRWAINVKPHDREPEVMTLGSNPGRDQQMRDASAFIDRQGVIQNICLKKSGKAFYFENAAGSKIT